MTHPLSLQANPGRRRWSRALPMLLGLAMAPVEPALCGVSTSAVVRLTTDYVYRGYTKSGGRPTLQANLDAFHSAGVFVGTWVSRVELDGARMEANPYVGARWQVSDDWRLSTSLAGYFYDEPVFGHSANYAEGILHLGYRDTASLQLSLAPDAYGLGHPVLDYQLDLRHPLTDTLDLTAGIGYSAARKSLSYDNLYWTLGITWLARRQITLDLRYYDARQLHPAPHAPDSEEGFEDLMADNPVVLSIVIGF